MKQASTPLRGKLFPNGLTWFVLCLLLASASQVAAQGGSPALVCNTPTSLTAPTYSVAIDPARTGIGGVLCALCGVTNTNNVIDNNPANFASIVLTAGLAVDGSIAVKDQSVTYPANTFIGFDISRPLLAGVGAFDGLTVSTYITGNPNPVQTFSGTSLLSANSSILLGAGRRTVGFLATQPFDEVRLTVSQLVGVTLGTTSVYGVVAESFCSGPSTLCADNTLPSNLTVALTNPTHPVYVDGNNTGLDGLACVGCSINNPQNVVDADLTNFATVVLTTGVATSASFAVANAVDTYPVNSFAGFDIEANTLVSANVLSTATITLYNNGAVVQTGTGNALIVGATTNLLNGRSRQIVGIVATASYDEVKITFNQLVGADLGTINIYSAFFEKLCAQTIACNTSYKLNNPTFPVVIDGARTGVTGAVAAATTIRDPQNVISADTTDFARITNTASGVTNASIAVLDPIDTYPTGTFAGFTVRRVSGIVAADLFSRLTVTTYLDGVQQESRSAGSLLDLSIALFGTSTNFFHVGFVTSKPFDEIQLTVAPLVGLAVLGGQLDVYGAFIDTRTSSGGGLICALNTNPDFAVTNINVPVSGNVKTNDIVPPGTLYGPAPAPSSQPAGSSPSLTVNHDGSYTFVSATPGVYVYAVPVCAAGQTTGCATQTLTITVLNPTVNTNNPVANADIATTTGSPTSPTAVTINVRANDGAGNPGGTLGTPTITAGPAHGTASIVGGNVVYTPTAGYYGTDMVTYQVCETPGTNLCATATVTITVLAPGSANTTVAADDYVSTYQGVAVTGNVKTNDTDPEGNTQTVTAQNTTIPGRGTLALAADGTFTFTPVAGATGPVEFTYTTCDNGSPSACATGTLHILVNPFNPNPDFAVTNKGVSVTGSVATNDMVPPGTTYGPAPAPASQPNGSNPTLMVSSTGSYTFTSSTPGVYVYNVPVCRPGQSSNCSTEPLTITVLDPTVTTNNPVANPDFATTTGSPTSPTAVTINVRVNDGPGNAGGSLGTPTIPNQPAHGTASIDGSGNLVYTPTAGYYGTDVVTYQVCETPGTNLCATTTVTLTVLAPGNPTVVTANDDYVSTVGGTPGSGNVLTNDLGTSLTVSNPGTTVTSSGTLVVTSTGSYTFTPTTGVTGPVNFTYTACDNSNPSVCASATLHVLVNQGFPDLTPIIRLPLGNFTASGDNSTRNFTVELTELNGQPTSSGNVVFTITAPLGYTLAYDNTITSINVSGGANNPVAVDNTKWTVTNNQLGGLQLTLTINAGQFIAANSTVSLGFTITRTAVNSGSTSNITVGVRDDAAKTYDSNPVNNIYARNINAL